ncbi:dienelactone hydrolase [Desulfuromonas versatilis]|uniref:Dienelactone hydrolase n=1 Tax=Desulfuromonas versatilis TaxID=2802975 RepID=A0ABM8HQY8_9BACT|nr:dienelactone hydrolase family protein [Desulfuromonas versatilis]BCR02995.1 dienelactone hydrolase [Desulfuromonas versatilis]
MARIMMLIALSLWLAGDASAAVQGKPVEYRAGETVLKGYLAWDDAVKDKRPGVLVVHEWWGHNEYARKRAEMLAGLGYPALAVDMYGAGRQAAHPDDAGKFAGELRKNLPLATERFLAALKLLKSQPGVDPEKLAAIGYCFGGGVVLEMARAGVELAGVASFHGSLGTEHPARVGAVKARLLVLNGADDPFVTPEQIGQFNQEMAAARVGYAFVNYPGAKHSFSNPQADEFGKKFNLPLAYHAEADAASWGALQEFFREIFQ